MCLINLCFKGGVTLDILMQKCFLLLTKAAILKVHFPLFIAFLVFFNSLLFTDCQWMCLLMGWSFYLGCEFSGTSWIRYKIRWWGWFDNGLIPSNHYQVSHRCQKLLLWLYSGKIPAPDFRTWLWFLQYLRIRLWILLKFFDCGLDFQISISVQHRLQFIMDMRFWE